MGKYVIRKIEKIKGKRNIRFSDEAVQDYPDGMIALLLTVAEIGFRAGAKQGRKEAGNAKKSATILRNKLREYKALYENELRADESKSDRMKKIIELKESGAEAEVTYTAKEYNRLRKQCRELAQKNRQLKAQYKNLREKVLDRGYPK